MANTTVRPRSASSRMARPEITAALHVHAGGRLVEEHQFRLGQQRERETQPLLLAAGAFADEPVADVGDAGACKHLVHRAGVREQRGGHADRLFDRQVLEQAGGLHDRGDLAPRDRVVGLAAVDRNRARRRAGTGRGSCRWSRSCRRRSVRGRRRSRRVRSEGQIVDRGDGTEFLRHPPKVNCQCLHADESGRRMAAHRLVMPMIIDFGHAICQITPSRVSVAAVAQWSSWASVMQWIDRPERGREQRPCMLSGLDGFVS